jgi:uncharacterized membrane protein YeaQ/YmgE (transglycosylase-associated protein family)
MGFIGWIVLGGLAGWIASIIMKTNKKQGLLGNIIVGVIGGLVGGWVFSIMGGEGVTGFNAWSLLVAVVGAMILTFLWGMITSKR